MSKVTVILKNGQKVQTHAETADLLIKMGKAKTEEQICREAEAKAKADAEAEQRETKIVTPPKTKEPPTPNGTSTSTRGRARR